jgi:predicted RecA/RadA family phage recombinase
MIRGVEAKKDIHTGAVADIFAASIYLLPEHRTGNIEISVVAFSTQVNNLKEKKEETWYS